MYLLFLTLMGVGSLVSLFIFFAVQKNVEHVTSGFLKILGEKNKELVKPSSLSILGFLYFLAIIFLPVLYYFFLVPNV